MKRCVTCLQLKPDSEFNWRYKSLGIRHNCCRDCHHKHQSNWYESHKEEHLENVHARKHRMRDEAREWVYQYLTSHPCVDCGEADPRVLQFDHVRGKNADISRLIADGAPIEKIQREIELCEVRCSNCHQKKTIDVVSELNCPHWAAFVESCLKMTRDYQESIVARKLLKIFGSDLVHSTIMGHE
jgi:hypothetical protein